MRKDTIIAMSYISKIDKKRIFRFAVIAAAVINLLIGAALYPLTVLLAENANPLTEAIYYLTKLLSMASFFGALGAAYFIASFKDDFKCGVKIISLVAVSSLVGLMISSVIQNFDVADGTLGSRLLSDLMSSTINSVVSFLIIFAGYAFPFRVFIQGRDVYDKLYGRRLLLSAICASSISALYNLVLQTIDTVDFVSKHAPLYTSEIFSIIYDYLFIIITSVLGVLIISLSRRLYCSVKFKNKQK